MLSSLSLRPPDWLCKRWYNLKTISSFDEVRDKIRDKVLRRAPYHAADQR